MSTRRSCLGNLGRMNTTHAGLWLDRYIATQDNEAADVRGQHIAQVADFREPADYQSCYGRWREALTQCGATIREATAQGRLVIGLGAEGVLETSITLHRTYGVPYLPGSALKGLAARWVRERLGEEWQPGSEAYTTLFGSAAAAGYVTFFDAWYRPHSGYQNRPLHSDVIAVHHAPYYRTGHEVPADWDDPIVVSFLTATGSYAVALAGPEQWVTRTFEILGLALVEMGIGAKTSSGYGRMKL